MANGFIYQKLDYLFTHLCREAVFDLLYYPASRDERESDTLDFIPPFLDILYEGMRKLESLGKKVTIEVVDDEFRSNRLATVVTYLRNSKIIVKNAIEFYELAEFLTTKDSNAFPSCEEIEEGLNRFILRVIKNYYLPSDRAIRILLGWPKYYFDFVYYRNTIHWPELKRLLKLKYFDKLLSKYKSVNIRCSPENRLDIYYKRSDTQEPNFVVSFYNVEQLEELVLGKLDHKPVLDYLLSHVADIKSFIYEKEENDFANFSCLVGFILSQLEEIGIGMDIICRLIDISADKPVAYSLGDIRALSRESLKELLTLYQSFMKLHEFVPGFQCFFDEPTSQIFIFSSNGKTLGVAKTLAELKAIVSNYSV